MAKARAKAREKRARKPRAGDTITKRVAVDLGEVIDRDLEGFLDLLAERAGDPLLSDIRYRVVGVDHRGAHSGAGSDIVIEVRGEASEEYGDRCGACRVPEHDQCGGEADCPCCEDTARRKAGEA